MRSLKWNMYQHTYKFNNPTGTKPTYPTTCSRCESNIIVRLRIGHCKFSHKYLLDKTTPPKCPSCNSDHNVIHILNECPAYHSSRVNIFGSSLPSDLLRTVNEKNIKQIYNYILENKLQNLI